MKKLSKVEEVEPKEFKPLKVKNLTEEEFNKILAIRISTDESLTKEENDKIINDLVKKIMIIIINSTDVKLPT